MVLNVISDGLPEPAVEHTPPTVTSVCYKSLLLLDVYRNLPMYSDLKMLNVLIVGIFLNI